MDSHGDSFWDMSGAIGGWRLNSLSWESQSILMEFPLKSKGHCPISSLSIYECSMFFFIRAPNRVFSFMRPVQIDFGLPPVSQVKLEIFLCPCFLLGWEGNSYWPLHLYCLHWEEEDPSFAEVWALIQPLVASLHKNSWLRNLYLVSNLF